MSTGLSHLTTVLHPDVNGVVTRTTQSTLADEVRAQLMRITPQMATDLLKNRLPNRPISKTRVRAMIADMRAGRWQVNGESIVLDGDLKLLDGQHRLMACAESGVTIQAMVVVGIAPSALMSIDQGYRKTGADMLAMHDMSNAQLLASVCRWLRRYEKQAMRVQASDLRNDALPAYVESRPGLQVALPWGRVIRDLLSAAPAAMLYYLMAQRDPVAAKHYYDNLSCGVGLTRESPAHIVRERLLKDKSSRTHMGIVKRAALVALGWVALRSEKSLPASITWRGCEDVSMPFPQVI